ncbi:hypothetical protein AB1K89_07125 [Sporosarcina sp. 179-K 8C2 HS]|uniref:hypothetical protein n=1 Tax=Sporosarcina sp. 179-K 8C2 HS TaxID=3142387 RepID=UPI00399FC9BB
MITRSLLLAFIGLFLIMVSGCSNERVNKEQKIEVQIRLDDEKNYKDFKEITDNAEVQKVKEILFDIEWENTKVHMEHPADYRFILAKL